MATSETFNSVERENPILFVVGCPRSGTTLLQRMLDHHPWLAVGNDTHFIPRVLEKTGGDALRAATAGEDVPLTDALVEAVQSYRRFARLDLSPLAVDRAAHKSTTYVDFVHALYDEFGKSKSKRFAGEKTPDYVRWVPLLATMFPQAKFVHIVRDGRDVALSTLQWASEKKGPGKLALWRESPVAVCAMWWRWLVLRARCDQAPLAAGRYLEVRYEAFVHDAGSVLETACHFLDIPYFPEMLKFNEGKLRPNQGTSAKKAWLAPVAGLRDWRQQMDSADVALFEALAGDTLREFGYETVVDDIPAEIAEAAATYDAWWLEHFKPARVALASSPTSQDGDRTRKNADAGAR